MLTANYDLETLCIVSRAPVWAIFVGKFSGFAWGSKPFLCKFDVSINIPTFEGISPLRQLIGPTPPQQDQRSYSPCFLHFLWPDFAVWLDHVGSDQFPNENVPH